MNKNNKNKIYVIGHRNPDTDSICSAISYAYLKNQTANEDEVYLPKRAGGINEETKYVLKKFNIDLPGYITDVSTQIKDIEIRMTQGINRRISLKKAWNLMKDLNVTTLPVTLSGKLEGIITTEDIAKAYMDVYDNTIIATAHTKYSNIIETLDGEILEGSGDEYFLSGKVLISAANPDIMEECIEEGDLVIVGNRYEAQLCAIEMHAACIVICDGANVTQTIHHLAKENNCTIITTPHDTFTVARLINQSMPISYFMKRDGISLFHNDDFTYNVKPVMAKKRYRDFPILDKNQNYVGMMSRRNLLNATRKKVILVDHNERTQAVDGLENAQIMEIIDHHRLGSVETVNPVFFRNQPLGCTATIIYQMYIEKNVQIPKSIAGLLLSAILSDTLMFRSPTCTFVDKQAAQNLAQIADVNYEELANEMFKAGSNLSNKSAEEIFYQDYKEFTVDGVSFGISQINSMTKEELDHIKEKMMHYMSKIIKELGVNSIYIMLTNILDESSELLFEGNEAQNIVKQAFGNETNENSVILKGVVSRKKQLLPQIMNVIQN